MAQYDYGYGSSRMLACGKINELVMENERLWICTSDVGGAFKKFQAETGRMIDTGIAEQSAAGIAAGLALEGKHVFLFGMLPFLSMRDLEQVRTAICYQNLPVTIIGTGGGLVSTGGSTHNCMEDVAIMRTLANMSVISVSDPNLAPLAVEAAVDWEGPLYIRQQGGKHDRFIYEPGSITKFEIGKGILAREGKDVLVIAHGGSVADSLDAALAVEADGISAEVIDMCSIKPLDEELLLKEAAKFDKVIVVEDHLRRGGLGGAVSELFMDNGVQLKKFARMGIPDVYAGFGPADLLHEKYGYGPTGIAAKIREFMQ